MADLDGIRALVQDAIDKGASTVEEVHTTIAAMPLEALKQVGPLSGLAESAEAVTMASIGSVYDTIRLVNQQAGEVAKQLLRGDERAARPSDST